MMAPVRAWPHPFALWAAAAVFAFHSPGPIGAATLNNLSVRTALPVGQTLTVGAVISGGTKRILVRAAGPALNGFGLAGMADPQLQLYSTGVAPMVTNDNWDGSLAPVFASVGAFPFVAGSKDAALSESLSASFTVQARGTNAGNILVEAYDVAAGTDQPGARLVNLSARNQVGAGEDILIAGFSIAGTGTKLLLIRGVGPGLTQFGVTGVLADPKIQLFDRNSTLVASNDNWDPSLAPTFTSLGAFSLAANSRDAALLVTLRAGMTYTVQVAGADGGTGEALVEVYEVIDPKLSFAAPAIVSTSPAIEATGAGLNSPVAATFSAPLSAGTLTTATFTLRNTASGAIVAGTVNVSGNTAAFTPTASLAANSTYTATITPGAKDAAGNALAASFTWNFTTGAAAAGFTLPLQPGSFWDFNWSVDTSTFAQGGSGSTTSNSGTFRITLGAPTTIQGVPAFPLVFSGQSGTNPDLRPRWKYVAFSNGLLRGSLDGTTLATILNPTSATMLGGGFFAAFGSSETIRITSGTFTGDYNTVKDALLAGHSSSAGGTLVIGDVTIYHDSSTSFSETESFKNGIGPLGLKRSMSYSSSGGGFFSSSTTTHEIELIRTSLAAADGSPIKSPSWTEVAPMATARKSHAAATFNGRIYVFGGYDLMNTALGSVEIFDPTANTWSAGTPPRGVTLTSRVARTVGNRIYLMPASTTEPVRIYDPALNSWTTGATGAYSESSHDGDVMTINTGSTTGDFIVMATTGDVSASTTIIRAYRPSDNLWFRGTDVRTYRRWMAATAVGDDLYIIGGYVPGAALTPASATGLTRKYHVETGAWSTLADLVVPRYSGKAVTLNGEPVMLGGTSTTTQLNSVEAFSPISGQWRTLSPMLRKRQDFAAVALNGKIYVIGGSSGAGATTSVEVYTP